MKIEYDWLALIVLIIAAVVVIVSVVFLDKRQERAMAEKGYCYQAVDRTNSSAQFQYQRCK